MGWSEHRGSYILLQGCGILTSCATVWFGNCSAAGGEIGTEDYWQQFSNN